MAELKEITDTDRFIILHEGKGKNGNLMNILVPFAQSDLKNSNGRIYPRSLLQREIGRLQKEISLGGFLGTADHPKSGNTELGNVSHIVRKMWMDEGGRGWAELGILDTQRGKDLKTIIKAGGRLGVSTRGFGTMEKSTGIVKDDYKLAGLDIVSNPSYKAGMFSQDSIFESADWTGTERNKTMNKKVQPKDCFYEAQIMGISSADMARKINEENEKNQKGKRLQLYNETLMACPEKSKEEINKIVDRTIVFESKIEPKKKKDLTEKVNQNAQLVLMSGGSHEDIRRLNDFDRKVEEKEKKRKDLITIISRTGKIAGFGSEEIEKLIKAELKIAGLD